jgi:hypothetical protein
LAVASASFLSVAGLAGAQVAPQQGNAGGFGANTGMGGGAFNPANRSSQQDYPAAEVQTVPIARARAATARAEEDQLMNDLHATVDRMWEDFNDSGAMTSAVKEENDAYFEYDDARRKALETLSNDPTYRAMVSLVMTLKTKLEDERPTSKKPLPADLERVLATATLKLSYASAASAMEAAALAADERVQETRARLVSAGQKTATLRSDFARHVHRSQEFLAARRNFDDSRIARITADAFLDGAIDARDYALNYAYYIHRFDQYSYSPALLGSGLYYGAGNGYYGR